MLPQRRVFSTQLNPAVFAKVSVLLEQRIRKPAQLLLALHLLLHLYRVSNSSQQSPAAYPVLVEILRAGSGQLGADVVQTTLETVAVVLRRDMLSCGPLVDLGIVTRLAEALQHGVASMAAKHAVEGLHILALNLHTSRDLILATGAVQTLVLQLRQAFESAHYAYLKEVLWTLICLGDDDSLCKEAVIAAGALPFIVPLLGVKPFDSPINSFICLPALAARAIRVLAEHCSGISAPNSGFSHEASERLPVQDGWQQEAVPHLVKMMSSAANSLLDRQTAEGASQGLLRSTSGLSQRLRTTQGQVAHAFGAWVLGRALLYHTPSPSKSGASYHRGALLQQDSDGEHEGLLGSDTDDLVDSSFLNQKSRDQAFDAAAEESLIRVLEAGPCTLDGVKEAAGALKVVLTGNTAAKQAATRAGAAEVVLQLLHDSPDTRLVSDAADMLTALTAETTDILQLPPNNQVLQQLVSVTQQLLRSCDAFTEDAHTAGGAQDGLATSVVLSGMTNNPSGHGELSSITEEPNQGLQLPAAPLSQALAGSPAWAFAQSASLKLQPGLPPILTHADGQHSQAAMPNTPQPPSLDPSAQTSTATIGTASGGVAASMSNGPTNASGWNAWPSSLNSISSTPNRSLNRSQSIGGTWVGGLLKRISSMRSGTSTETTEPSLQRSVSFQQPQKSASILSPFAPFADTVLSPAASHTPTGMQMPLAPTLSNWVLRKPSCSRHPAHTTLQATVTALANLIAARPGCQDQAQHLGCIFLALDVLSLGARVGVRGGLAGPAAKLIRCVSEGSAHCQQMLGQAGAVGQLLALLQDASCCDLEEPNSIRLPLIAALHAVLEGNKANQLAFQAAGGVEVIMHLLTQASPSPQTPLPPSLSTEHSEELEAGLSTQNSRPQADAAALPCLSPSQALATSLVWLMGAAASDAPANQAALHEQGAVQLLLHQLQWGREPASAQASLWALACLVKGNVDIQNALEAQGGIKLLTAYLTQDSTHAESAALALHHSVALHAPNQAAARQAGTFPALLGLLQTSPDSPATECAARCVHALAQDCLANQDAACQAGLLAPLLSITSAGADKLAAKSAALAVATLTCNHTANQDAVRRADGIAPLIELVKAGARNQAAVCAASALASVAANNGINQQSIADCGGVPAIVDLLASACQLQHTSAPCIQAMKALAACIDGSLPNQETAVAAGAPALLCQLASSTTPHTTSLPEFAWQVSNAVACLTRQCPSAQQACSNAVISITSLLSHSDTAVAEQACQALASLVAHCPKNQAAAQQLGAIDSLMSLLLTAQPDSADVQQWKHSLVHLIMAVLLVTADDASSGMQMGQTSAGDHQDAAVGPAAHVSTAASAKRLNNALGLEQKLSFALSFSNGIAHVAAVRALLHLLDNQQAFRSQVGRFLRYQAAEWQVQHYVADFFVQVPPLSNMPYDKQRLSDIGFDN